MATARQRSASEKQNRKVLARADVTPRARGAAAVAAPVASITPRGSSRPRQSAQQPRSLIAAARLRSSSASGRTPRARTPRDSAVHGCFGAAGGGTPRAGSRTRNDALAASVQAVPVALQHSNGDGSLRGGASSSARSSGASATPHGTAADPRAQRRRSTSLEQQVSYNEQIAFRKQRSDESVRVAVRFRPLWAGEESQGVAFTVRPDRRIVESADLTYSFELDWAFGAEVLQSQVYNEIGHPIVSDVLNGYNGTVLAYGQTGSGKTYCMFGPQIEQPGSQGLMPRTARQIFDAIRAAPDDFRFVLRCSLLEIYCEQLRDLLDPSNQRPLRIVEHPKKGIFVDNLSQECVDCEEDIIDILQMGSEMRKLAATRLNKLSSRSHVLFFVTCEQKFPDGAEKVGKLSLVDLAGSERVGKSGALNNGGIRLQEAKSINCSLTALGYIIQALAEKQQHVPYRNSQLTRVLQETIGGNCKTTLLVACSSCMRHLSETLSSLRFATRARSVRNHVKVNLIHSAEQLERYVRQLQCELLAERREAARVGASIPKNLSLPFQEEEEDGAADLGKSSGATGSTAPVSCSSNAFTAAGLESSATLQSNASSEEPGPSNQELEAEYAASRVFGEIAELVTGLKAQDERVREILRSKFSGDELDPASELLRWRAKRNSLEWRLVQSQHLADVNDADAAAEDACADRHMGDLADAYELVRVHRLNLRRHEAQSICTPNAALGDSILNGTEVTMESMILVGGGLDTSGCSWLPPWATRARSLRLAPQSGHRGSKVVRPISRRSIERHSTSGASCHSSSCSSTPREAVSLMSPRRLGEADAAADEVCANPVQEVSGSRQDQEEESEDASSPNTSAVICGPAVPFDGATIPHALAPADTIQVADSRCDAGVAAAGLASPSSAMPVRQSGTRDEIKMLKAEIKRVRAEQEVTLRNFESRRARVIEDCWAMPILEHIRVLEEDHLNVQGEIPHVQCKLEQADSALEELELVGDATELEILRLECQLERNKRKLNARWAPLEDIDTNPFRQALGRVVDTIASLHSRRLADRASCSWPPESSRHAALPAEKENRPPDMYGPSRGRQGPLLLSQEVQNPVSTSRSGHPSAVGAPVAACTASLHATPQRGTPQQRLPQQFLMGR